MRYFYTIFNGTERRARAPQPAGPHKIAVPFPWDTTARRFIACSGHVLVPHSASREQVEPVRTVHTHTRAIHTHDRSKLYASTTFICEQQARKNNGGAPPQVPSQQPCERPPCLQMRTCSRRM